MKGYIKIQEASARWGISERRINTLCLEGSKVQKNLVTLGLYQMMQKSL